MIPGYDSYIYQTLVRKKFLLPRPQSNTTFQIHQHNHEIITECCEMNHLWIKSAQIFPYCVISCVMQRSSKHQFSLSMTLIGYKAIIQLFSNVITPSQLSIIMLALPFTEDFRTNLSRSFKVINTQNPEPSCHIPSARLGPIIFKLPAQLAIIKAWHLAKLFIAQTGHLQNWPLANLTIGKNGHYWRNWSFAKTGHRIGKAGQSISLIS